MAKSDPRFIRDLLAPHSQALTFGLMAAVGEGIVLVEPRLAEGLTEALRELLGDRERRQALAIGARLTVEREFTWERCGERTLAAYEAALA